MITFGIVGFIIFTSVNKKAVNNVSDIGFVDIIESTNNKKGPDDAYLKIVEFSDFKCPYCAEISVTVEALADKFGGDVQVVFVQFPLPGHQYSFNAALASEAASNQGKFWEYSRELFNNQDKIDLGYLEILALDLNLDMDRFKSDMNSEVIMNKVHKEFDFGSNLNILGTPTFYFLYDGKAIVANIKSGDDLIQQIETILKNKN